MTQAAPEALAARRRGREAYRDSIANSDERPGTGENSTVAPERLAEAARAVQAADPTRTAAADPHFRAGLPPITPTRVAGNTGARPEGSTPQTSRDRGTDRGTGSR